MHALMCVVVLVVIVPRLGLSVRLDRDLLGSEVYLRLTEVDCAGVVRHRWSLLGARARLGVIGSRQGFLLLIFQVLSVARVRVCRVESCGARSQVV